MSPRTAFQFMFSNVLVVAIATVAMINPLKAAEGTMDQTITVSASGEVSVEPDAAQIQTGVTTQAPTAREAMTANNATMAKLIAELKEIGIPAGNIQTSSINVQPRYQNHRDGRPATLTGYIVSNDVTIETDDLDNLGDILDRIVSLGATQMRGLNFLVLDSETLKDEARKNAIANARRRAELYASAAGAKVGKVVHISEETSHSMPGPQRMARATMESSVPIERGTKTLTARVTVTWKLDN